MRLFWNLGKGQRTRCRDNAPAVETTHALSLRYRMRLSIQISSNQKITVLEILFLTVVDNAPRRDNACVVSTVPNAFAQTNSSNQKITVLEILFLTVVDNAPVVETTHALSLRYRMRLPIQNSSNQKITVLEILFPTVVDIACVVSTVPHAFAHTEFIKPKNHRFGNPVSNRRRQRMRLPIQNSSKPKISPFWKSCFQPS